MGITLEESQSLARPRTSSLMQQELMSWHHRIYHLPFRILFRLSSTGLLTKRFLEFRNKPPICVSCQFGAAHSRPWQTKGKKGGLVCIPEQTNPGDGFLVD